MSKQEKYLKSLEQQLIRENVLKANQESNVRYERDFHEEKTSRLSAVLYIGLGVVVATLTTLYYTEIVNVFNQIGTLIGV